MPRAISPPEDGAHTSWLAVFDRALLRKLVSRRSLDVALASDLRYARPPVIVKDEDADDDDPETAVHATLGDEVSEDRAPVVAEGSRFFRVELRVVDGNSTLSGECSRCVQTFGPCLHVAVLAVDLACSSELRKALLDGASTDEAAARAPEVRFAVDAEVRFDGALGAWLAPTANGTRVEIAASPFADIDPHLGRTYGEKFDPAHTRVLSVVVRRADERKLLSSNEIVGGSRERVQFGARDRRVLEYARDRGSGRKAVYAVGVEASLTIEAMRVHAGVFADGYKGLLEFRAETVRPSIALVDAGAPGSKPPFASLAAQWVTEKTATRIAFADSIFFAGPFPFVWTKAGAIYRVARDVDLDFATQLARASTLLVPRGKLREAGSKLLRAARGRGIALPAHETFGLPPTETPRIVLRLAGEPLDVTGELLAVYREREVSLFPADGVGSEEGRDLQYEAQARAHMEAAGVVRHGDEDAAIDDSHIAMSDEAAIAFWQEGLIALRAASDPPIDVQLSERLARVRIGAPLAGRVHVVLEGNWLDTRLEFTSKELPVELDVIRAALARKKRWVALSDGTLSRVSSSIAALAEEASEVMKGAEAKLPAHQLGRLDRWIDENDGRMDVAVDTLRSRLRALAVAVDPDMPSRLDATLRPYQRLGLSWLQFLQAIGAGGILADDMGLGKTITTLAFLQRRKELEGPAPTLVVCPTSVATNWVREAARFTPDLRVLLLHGPSRERAAAAIAESDVVVTTYALLRRDIDALAAIRFRCAVLDEAQNIKNSDSATTRAAGRLDASMRLALSGTPIENRLRELWSLASFANPGILGTARAFETRFERPIATDRGSPLAAELRAIVRPFLLRRTKDEVLKELPPKTEIDRVVTLKAADKRMYDALAHSLRAGLAKDVEKRGGLASLSVFTALTRLRQMACDPRLVDARLAHEGAESAKREAFLELVRELVAEGRRALVFSQFVQLLTLWRKDLDAEGIGYEYLDGKTTKRDEVVARFQEGRAPLFLISLKAGGAGLNLTAADTVIHCDPWWNPAVEDQATDRAYRIGQDKPVTVVRLVARGTIEEKIFSLKAKKRELTKVVIGDDARALEGLTEDDVRLLLGDAEVDDDAADDDDDGTDERAPTDVLATAKSVLDPDFDALVVEVQWWLASTGRLATDLAALADLPAPFAVALANGEPFPCSRAVADRISARLRAW
jgi:superfamily II DNA or RNA helicase